MIFGKLFEKLSTKTESAEEQKKREAILRPRPEEEVLESGEVAESKRLEGGSGGACFIKFKDGNAAVFKPEDEKRCGFWYEHGFEPGSLCERERAAYLVDKFFGFDLAPPVVIRKINGQIGSIQQFIDAEAGLTEKEFETQACQRQLMKLWLLDNIIWNWDRNGSNILYQDEKDRLFAIDNELSLNFNGQLPMHFYEEFWDKPVPQEIKDLFANFLSWDKGQEVLRKELGKLIGKKDTDACFTRIKRLGRLIGDKGKVPKSELTNLTYD